MTLTPEQRRRAMALIDSDAQQIMLETWDEFERTFATITKSFEHNAETVDLLRNFGVLMFAAGWEAGLKCTDSLRQSVKEAAEAVQTT